MQNNLFFELLPLIGFFAVYSITKNIFTATLVCIGFSWLQLGFYHLKYNKIAKNTWLSTILITLFGGLTILLHNKTFVMLKPTVLYWLLALSMLISARLGKNGLKLLLKEQITLSDKGWTQVNLLWVLFFITMGALNLIIAFKCNEDTWVKFKVFGGIGLMFIFTLISGLFIYIKARHYQNELH